MWIHTAGRLILNRQIHLIGTLCCDHVSWKDSAIIGDYNLLWALILHMNWNTIKLFTILPKNVGFGALSDNRINRQNQPLVHFTDR